MPNDVPPRSGAPGYAEFIAHQQGKDVTTSATAGAPAAAAPASASAAAAAPAPAGGNPQIIPGNRRPNDQSAVEGGLY